VQLVGTTVNRDSIGALARVFPAGGKPSPWAMVKTGSSYASQSELPLTFGLAKATRVDKIEIKCPNGRSETLPGVIGDQRITITEGRGITSRSGAPQKTTS
jgi:hypothetical protein